ncbi:hypothetical protein COLO4_31252 [Corchorus olitorius]|uniref:Rho GTPase-activating protein 7 n=1 Tax=Corchorus olitorius TaxID=93759 RepID=A0A1R3H512_9ROSI|nr:hypothetical protein COLO4_31252 [Corchorus olitorius]
MSASLAAFERPRGGASITVFKSGPLFISSKGIGWKLWKKRWFILTRTCLVFFKNDPQRGGEDEVNLSLGGIELNNSGSVVIREDKKLLTVLFPESDGGDFTLKAETSEDLHEWKTALEHALAQAPSDHAIQWRDKCTAKSLVVGRPILLALEDIDGSPSFLEKGLRFLEEFGSKAEGILRQCADVEEVDCRVEEYEEGRKTEFGSDEDAHVVGDCVKYVLRELPSSPVPASCCTALLEAYKIQGKEARISAMRSAILDKTFPEPNKRLLQRVLKMMHTVSCHAQENRMTPSAVAACMAPLLLRPLLAVGEECELDLEDEFGDNSAQLLVAAANAANNAQAIITTLVEEYENIFVFDDENLQRCSNVGSPRARDNNAQPDDSSSLALDPPQITNPDSDQLEEQVKGNENPINEVPKGESNGSMGEILSTFWGRSNQAPSMESVDSCGEEEVDIQRLEMTKNDLQHRIAKEARGNAILQARLETRKQALHQRRLALEQHFSRLQEVSSFSKILTQP